MKSARFWLALAIAGGPTAHSAEKLAPESATKKTIEKTIVAIKLSHIAPSTMARWLLQPLPPLPELKTLRRTPFGALQNVSVLPNEAEREVWIRAAPQDLGALRGAIAKLDQPLQSIEFKVQSMLLEKTDLPILLPALPEGTFPPDIIPQIVPVRDHSYNDAIQSLRVQGRLIELQTRRMIVTANDSTWLSSIDPKATEPPLMGRLSLTDPFPVFPSERPRENLFVARVEPLINVDGSIACALMMGWPKTISQREITMRDGETLAVYLWDYHKPRSQVTITFFTPHIVRAVENTEKK